MKNLDNRVSCSGVIHKLNFFLCEVPKVDGINIPTTFSDKLAIIGRVNIGLLLFYSILAGKHYV